MAQVQAVAGENTPWMVRKMDLEPAFEESSADDFRDDLVPAPDRLCNAVRFFHPGTETDLQLYEVRIAPNMEEPHHTHEMDEIIYVVSGELRLGPEAYGPGSSVYVPGGEQYGYRSGPQGLHFLNFRRSGDPTMLNTAVTPRPIGSQA